MIPSLSIVLPVWNAQGELKDLIEQLEDVVPELTPRFDITIVDDGSTDATHELARDLARQYPQVRCVEHPARLGTSEALRSALRQSAEGELVLLRRDDCRLDLRDLHRLWNAIVAEEAVVARAASRQAPGRTLAAEGLGIEPDLQLVRRRVLTGWLASETRDPLITFLLKKRVPLREIALAERRGAHGAARRVESAKPRRGEATPRIDAPASQAAGGGAARRPNYLERLKAFALGE